MQIFCSLPVEDDVTRFMKAIQSLLDEKDASKIKALAQRLSPFRIDLQQKDVFGTVTVEPTLIFEDNQPTQ